MSKVSVNQIPLSVQLRDDSDFDSFFVGGNGPAVQSLKMQLTKQGERFIYLWGAKDTGCSHLLQAACHTADNLGLSSVYLPLDELVEYAPEVLEGLEHLDLVCLDNIEVISSKDNWQEALFHFFNKVRDSEGHLLIAGKVAPNGIGLELKDLESRLNWGLTFQVMPLSDEEKVSALQLRAQVRGLELSEDVGRYILSRSDRNMKQLYELLDQLDEASLQAQRKLTKPFIKETLGW